jgi:hypothetical protein
MLSGRQQLQRQVLCFSNRNSELVVAMASQQQRNWCVQFDATAAAEFESKTAISDKYVAAAAATI